MNMTQLAPDMFVGPQITASDLARLASEGFTDVVCNRPDAEHPGSDTSTQLAQVAQGLGMGFHYLPIVPGDSFGQQARELAAILGRPQVKVFAYCRSGLRASNAWSLTQSRVPSLG